ncbi:unnamed protein product [Rhizophagus irregularis]|nr:unnamed protein product [Rhizophagus irregularis]
MLPHENEEDNEIESYAGEYDSEIEAELLEQNNNSDNEQNTNNECEGERNEIIPNDMDGGPICKQSNVQSVSLITPCVIIDNIQDKILKEFTTSDAIIQHRRCIGCKQYITFYSRGEGCSNHSWLVNGRNALLQWIAIL